jgi:myo-inositol-1-phosphate synthase
MAKIKIPIIGVGNCASALVQGIHHYRHTPQQRQSGLIHWNLGGYLPGDIEVVAAYDIDSRKVGRDLSEAIFAKPNCTTVFHAGISPTGVTVQMGPLLDGVAEHMAVHDLEHRFDPAPVPEPEMGEVVEMLRRSGAEVLVNFLPVGSQQATEFYIRCALEAGLAVVNCIPVFIASDPQWSDRFHAAGLPLVGDDVKSQVGATIVHRVLTDLFKQRGVKLSRTYQLNTGGNTDFLNMLDRDRLTSKKISKTEAVQAVAAERLKDRNIHVGPSDYVPWQGDNKVGFIRLEGELFGGVPMHLEMRLSVEDSPNSAAVVVDAIRCARLALEHRVAGILEGPSAYFCKHPPVQYSDQHAAKLVEEFIEKYGASLLSETLRN